MNTSANASDSHNARIETNGSNQFSLNSATLSEFNANNDRVFRSPDAECITISHLELENITGSNDTTSYSNLSLFDLQTNLFDNEIDSNVSEASRASSPATSATQMRSVEDKNEYLDNFVDYEDAFLNAFLQVCIARLT